jgi:hypothetical protein
MSFGKALYFPYIHFQDETWLKYSLLYWDAVKRIVPRHYLAQDSDSVSALAKEGLIENVDPQSGETPYTTGAAEEFVPTINQLIKAHNGRLGRGIPVATSLEENASDSFVHLEKMDERVRGALTDAGLAEVVGDWMKLRTDLAGYYMLCLAAHISEKQNAPLLSDSFEMETGGTYFQHSRISPGVEYKEYDASFQLARMVLPVARPESLADLDIRSLIKFHKKYEPERMQFREAIEKVTQGAAKLTDPAAIRDFLEEKKRNINNALKDQKRAVEELNVGIVDSLLSVSVPGVVAGAFANFNPISMAIGAGAGLAISFINWAVKARGAKRKTVRDSDWHYLLLLERHLNTEEVARKGRAWFDQFTRD